MLQSVYYYLLLTLTKLSVLTGARQWSWFSLHHPIAPPPQHRLIFSSQPQPLGDSLPLDHRRLRGSCLTELRFDYNVLSKYL